MSTTNTLIKPVQYKMQVAKKIFLKLLSFIQHGQIEVIDHEGKRYLFGKPHSEIKPASLIIKHPRFYRRVLLGGDIAMGETWVEQLWESNDLTALLVFLSRNLESVDKIEKKLGWLLAPMHRTKHWFNRNRLSQTKKNISAHYDLGNELYSRLLDPTMSYSSAIFTGKSVESLEDAQYQKIDRILDQLDLKSSDHLLEIGTGWGALAIRAVTRFNCKVTTTTLSEEQFDYAKNKIKSLGLDNSITVILKDYRELNGHYDKIVSVEMIEAVGKKYIPVFFKQCNKLLKKGGKIAIQAITMADQRMEEYSKNVDFIQKHIFPGGFLPSVEMLATQVSKNTSMVIKNLFDFGTDYAKTISSWRKNLLKNQTELKQFGYDQRFILLWLYYFAYCEAGFLTNRISVVQLTMEKY
jgi:cyclopropane-fatty-acyl-phospholipid synthase